MTLRLTIATLLLFCAGCERLQGSGKSSVAAEVMAAGESGDDGVDNSAIGASPCRIRCAAPACSGCDDGVGNRGAAGASCAGGGCRANRLAAGSRDARIGNTRIATGADHTCTLLDTGAVRCWGYGGNGRLGYGNSHNVGDNEIPAGAGNIDLGGTVTQIAAGSLHTCALLNTGAVRCWGAGGYGSLGYGDTRDIGDDEVPASAGDVDVGAAVTQISLGYAHSCALVDTGAVRCWGLGGRLGYGHKDNIGDDETPNAAGDIDVGGTVAQIAAGSAHTCALLDTGTVRCWGIGSDGRLGYGNGDAIGDDETPAEAGDVDVGGKVVQIAAGGAHTCALLEDGAVRCWGLGFRGALGYGNEDTIGDDETPAEAGNVDVGGPVFQVEAGGFRTCVRLAAGAVQCWGSGEYGAHGYGNTDNIGDNEVPSSTGAIEVGGEVVEIAAGNIHTCAIRATGAVRCWGYGGDGRLGHGNTANIGDNEPAGAAGDVQVD